MTPRKQARLKLLANAAYHRKQARTTNKYAVRLRSEGRAQAYQTAAGIVEKM